MQGKGSSKINTESVNTDSVNNNSGNLEQKSARKNPVWRKYGILLILIAVLILFCFYENHHLTITEYVIWKENLPQAFADYRIVQISDLHNAVFGLDNQKLLGKIRELQPDIIALTGDIVDSNHTDVAVALAFCREAVAIAPVYYVTGNHEYWLSEEEQQRLFQGMEAAGVVILHNEITEISRNGEDILLAGVDDKNLADGTLLRMMKDREKGFCMVLAHEPQYFSQFAMTDADLVLTGHAHGGQFILPFVGPVVAPDQGLFPEYTQGQHSSGFLDMIISRGLGNSIIPVRLFNDPEIVLVRLVRN